MMGICIDDIWLAVPHDVLPKLTDDFRRASMDPTSRVVEAEQRLDLTVRGVATSCRVPYDPDTDGPLCPDRQEFIWHGDSGVVEFGRAWRGRR